MRKTRLLLAVAASLFVVFFSTGTASAATSTVTPSSPVHPSGIVYGLPPGTVLAEGWGVGNNGSVYSSDGGTQLFLNRGLLQVWHGYNHVWTASQPSAGNRVNFQTDGNLVVYNSSNAPVWASNTGFATCGPVICYLDIQNDGNVVIYTDIGFGEYESVWATNTVK